MREFKLIDSTYNPEDSKDVLLNLISDKVKFLNTKVLRKLECEGVECEHSKQRAAALRKEAEELAAIFNELSNEDVDLKIECTVSIQKVEKGSSTSSKMQEASV